VDSVKGRKMPAPTLVLLASTLLDMGDADRAIAVLQQAQLHYPGDLWVNIVLANSLHNVQPPRLDQAIALYGAARVIRPQIAGILSTLGAALAKKGLLDEAVAVHKQAIALDPNNAPAYCNLGVALVKKGRRDEAMTAFKDAIRIYPDFLFAHCNLGNM